MEGLDWVGEARLRVEELVWDGGAGLGRRSWTEGGPPCPFAWVLCGAVHWPGEKTWPVFGKLPVNCPVLPHDCNIKLKKKKG